MIRKQVLLIADLKTKLVEQKSLSVFYKGETEKLQQRTVELEEAMERVHEDYDNVVKTNEELGAYDDQLSRVVKAVMGRMERKVNQSMSQHVDKLNAKLESIVDYVDSKSLEISVTED